MKMECSCPVTSPDVKTVFCRPQELDASLHFREVPLPFHLTKVFLSKSCYEKHLAVIRCLKYGFITNTLLHSTITEIQAIRDWETKLVKYTIISITNPPTLKKV